MSGEVNHLKEGILNFSIQNGINHFQQKCIEDRKKKNAIDKDEKIFNLSNKEKKVPAKKMVFDEKLNSHVQKVRKEIVPFEFSETKVLAKNDVSESRHDEYVKSNDNSIVLKQVYQDKLRDNTDDLKKNLNKN